jgi:hypothetical protein
MLVNNVAINNGDYVGAFYQSSTGLACAGYKKIFSASDTLTAYGAMPGQGNGFAAGEVIKWRIWKESTSTAYQAFAVYDPQAPQQGNFAAGGLSLVSINLAEQSCHCQSCCYTSVHHHLYYYGN